MRNSVMYSVKYRCLAFFLCLVLCIEGSSMQVFAAEEGVNPSTDLSESTDDAKNADSSDNTEDADNGDDTEDADNGDDAEDADNSDDTGNADNSGNTADVDGSDDTENTDSNENNGDEDDTDHSGDSDIEDGTNDSDNQEDSQDGNSNMDDPAEELPAMVEEAEDAFDMLIAQKDLMALLYHTDSYSARKDADADSAVVAALQIGQTLYIKNVKITEQDVWYQVQYWLDGVEGTGYVQSFYLAYSDEDWIAWEEQYLRPILESGRGYGSSAYGINTYSMITAVADTSDINAFPISYQSALKSLKSAHSNWIFVPLNTGLDFNTSVSKEMGVKSLIQKTTSNVEKGWVGDPCPTESGWNYATNSAVSYHMDPRNFLTETYIFQFEQLTFNASYHTTSAVQTFLDGTFMKGTLADDSRKRTYAQAFYEIGQNRKLSPIHLASRVYQEQGQGTSDLISGTYPGYEGYYNFFNVGVNGSSTAEKVVKGLTYAKNQGWNTRYKSLEGGAATIGNNYILKYQDTIYLEKFNVDKNSPYGVYEHQYMQNIQAPASESSSTRKMYNNAGSLNSAFVFKIPVYNNMPSEIMISKTSLNIHKGRTQQLTVTDSGTVIAPTQITWESSNKSVATIKDGVITAVDEGETIITAVYGNAELTCRVTVTLPTPKINKPTVTLNKGTTQQLTIFVDGIELDKNIDDYGNKVTWRSNNLSVATVEDGLVTAVGAGEAVITASYVGVEVACTVTVKIPLESISLNEEQIALRRPDTVVEDTTGLSEEEKRGNTATASLQVSFDPIDTTADKAIAWTSSDTKIATVKADPADSSKAVITAVNKGEVTITAKASKAGGQTAKCKVSVSAPIYKLTMTNLNEKESSDQTTLLVGQSVSLSTEYWPKDTTSDTQVIWSSSQPEVASVKNGRVEAVGEGTAVITAWISGCERGYTAQHTVVVKNCTVTFMITKQNGELDVQERPVPGGYGSALPIEDFPEAEPMEDSIFIGWYTGENGTGSRFDETTVIYRQNITVYPYYEEQGHGFYVLPVGDQTYTGTAIKPVVQVYDSVTNEDGSKELIELVFNRDYTVSYKNNKKVNLEGKTVPTITVKGKGNYTGSQTVFFNIIPKALTDTDITVSDITVAYSGKAVKSAPAVYRNGKKLVKNTDYTVAYPQTGTGAYKTAGSYPIVITGKDGYDGTVTIHEVITNDVLMSKVSIAKIPNQTYFSDRVNKDEGSGIIPESLQVTYKKQTLVESTDNGLTGDYTVSYQNNMAIGTATVTITAVEGSGYIGSKSITYKIVGTSIAKAQVEGLSSREYTGSEEDAKQDDGAYTLTLNNRVLTESRDGGLTGDYVVSYTNTSKVGTAAIVFKGINEYTGQLKKTYKITKYNISPDENGRNDAITMQYYTQDEPDNLKPITTLSEITTPYVKGGSKPAVILYFNGIELTPGKDYKIQYANQNAVTTEEMPESKLPKITITGKGNFNGSIIGYYTITDGLMSKESKLTMTAKDVVYKNKKNAYKSSVVLKDCNGSKLTAGKDYDKMPVYTYEEDTELTGTDGDVILRRAGDVVEAEDIPPVGTVIRVTVYGIGFYTGDGAAAISTIYRITAADISKAKVTVQPQVYRNGQEVMLTKDDLTVTVSGVSEPLVCGMDYTIDESTYTNNTNKGKATVVIHGQNHYGGEKKVTFTIKAKTLWWWKNVID